MKSSNVGGQAVLEGVMMKHKDRYAVAVRKPDGTVVVEQDDYKSIVGSHQKLLKTPFIRGIFNFIDSMILGMKTLTWSAGFEEEEEKGETGSGDQRGRHGGFFPDCHRNFYGSSVFSVRSVQDGHSVLCYPDDSRRRDPDSDFCRLYLADLQDGGYPASVPVSWCRA